MNQNSSPRDETTLTERISVLLPLPLAGAYDYAVPRGLNLHPGDFVTVPLGPRERTGVVWGAGDGDIAADRLKPVVDLLPAPPLSEEHRRFIDRVAAYTVSPPGAVLRMAMSVPEALSPPRPITFLSGAPLPQGLKLTDARKRVLAAVADGSRFQAADLARKAEASSGVIKGLVAAGALHRQDVVPTGFQDPGYAYSPAELSPDQEAAAAVLRDHVGAGYCTTLLEGVTGSGKTEVYFDAIAAALEAGRQCLVLLPEIALSAQWLNRFEERFGVAPACWHSDVRRPEKRRLWRQVAEGGPTVVVGARSALFLPFQDLGLIVVDEEHDGSFKQEDGVSYHARDMAVLRGHLAGCPVVLASATPSLETQANVEAGRYGHVMLPDRHAGAAMPEIALVDLRRDPPPRQHWLSPVVQVDIGRALEAGDQVMLFLNRRGYAPLTLCRTCGHRYGCPQCSAWLVDHRLAGRIVCHHCGHAEPRPRRCQVCDDEDALVACGPGVERLAEEVQTLFPDAELALMTSDTVRGADAAAALVSRVEAQEVDILIGTQMMAKGHHFPQLTLVVVVDADLGFAGADPRAAERTWQMLSQVGGRAGRGERPGHVLLQTYLAEQPVLKALAEGNVAAFLDGELEARSIQGLPPFGRLASLIVSGRDQARVREACRNLLRAAPRLTDVSILGPAPAVMAILRGHHRQRFLVKAAREVNVQAVIRDWLEAATSPSGVSIKVDIDPLSFY